ncbi:fibronectin-like [Leptopilina heterotoma]|uniref:fibronectin-like n=1 Tax=Leptopilina heterotoma TaxID=63436 RepID=UPI001CA7CCFD|nr:fibronectin-like [Leptopilina heterotoma]
MKFTLFIVLAEIFVCISVSAIDQLRVLNVTSTTCTLYWKQPLNDSTKLMNIIRTLEYNYIFYPYSNCLEAQYTCEWLQPATVYNISVDIYFRNGTEAANPISTECTTKPMTDIYIPPVLKLEVLEVTTTTCKISWIKPTRLEQFTKYVITVLDNDSNYTSYRYFSSLSKLQYTIEDLKPGTNYDISVYIDYKDNEVTTSCITKPQLGELKVLESTNTLCKIIWKKPINNDETLKYVVSAVDSNSLQQKNKQWEYYENIYVFQPEILVTLPNLQPGSNYSISVFNDKTNTTISTECITKAELGQLTVLDSTDTTCRILWKKPTDSYDLLKYDVTVFYSREFNKTYEYYSCSAEVHYTLNLLQSATKFNISVYIWHTNTLISTECITKVNSCLVY